MSEQVVRVGGGTPWEQEVGYCRAVRTGAQVHVSGTIGVDEDGAIVGPGDAYAQTRRALERIRGDLEQAGADLEQAGADLEHVIRTRIFVTDITKWRDVARAHREAFGGHPPASTLVEVTRLVLDDALVEIEADALIDGGPGD